MSRKALHEIGNYIVREQPNGGWSVSHGTTTERLSVHDTDADAIAAAQGYQAERNTHVAEPLRSIVNAMSPAVPDARTDKIVRLARRRPADGSLPKSITVRKAGEDRALVTRPRNLIELAAQCDDRDMAISALLLALGIADNELAEAILCDRDMWRRIPRERRLSEIGDLLKAQCIELMDLIEVPRISTIGD